MAVHRRLPRPRSVLIAAALLLAAPWALSQDMLRARNLAATCANCHGTNGHAIGEMKPLAGMAADKIVGKVADFGSGVQSSTLMHQMAKGYTAEQIRLIAEYFAAQPAGQ